MPRTFIITEYTSCTVVGHINDVGGAGSVSRRVDAARRLTDCGGSLR
jgi:hypothetical protein